MLLKICVCTLVIVGIAAEDVDTKAQPAAEDVDTKAQPAAEDAIPEKKKELPASKGRPRPKVGRPPRTELSHPCSRQHSRVVRNMLSKAMTKQRDPAEKAAQWPDGCFLNPEIDMWGYHEKNKSRQNKGRSGPNQGTLWTCGYNNKTFKSEHYLDLHLERYFMNQTSANGKCLADHCEPFNLCGEWGSSSMWDFVTSEPPPCDADHLLPLYEQCSNALDSCFPTALNKSAYLKKNWCDHLSCPFRAERHRTHRSQLITVACVILGLIILVLVIRCCVLDDRKDDPVTRHDRVYHKKRQ